MSGWNDYWDVAIPIAIAVGLTALTAVGVAIVMLVGGGRRAFEWWRDRRRR